MRSVRPPPPRIFSVGASSASFHFTVGNTVNEEGEGNAACGELLSSSSLSFMISKSPSVLLEQVVSHYCGTALLRLWRVRLFF